jgi:formylglycine-generating enzyme required for sulfatase activity
MMKRASILLFAALVSLSFHKSGFKKFIPPGTIQINDTLFADINEITNLSWWEYQYWVRMEYGVNSAEYRTTIQDTSVWLLDGMTSNEPYQSRYSRHTSFKNHPVVGVSFEQAVAFCKWRTERVKYYLAIAKKYAYPEFEYRLPTKKEWEFISGGGSEVFSQRNYVLQVENKKDRQIYKNFYKANCYINDTINFQIYSKKVSSYPASHLGLYDVIGNVSEMTNQKGISKGGSWKHKLDECRTGKDIPYSKPEAWLGFRSVCILKKVAAQY